jgi:hypothetical protein
MAWQRIDDPSLDSGRHNASMRGVLAGEPGFVAWGSIYPTGPRIWWSIDGLAWESASVPAIEDAWVEELYLGEVGDVVAAGPGFVAIGSYVRHDGWTTSIVWTSADAKSWERIPFGPVFERSHIDSVVAHRGELLAVGCELATPNDCGRPLVWSSTDGRSWRRTTPTLPEGVGALGLDAADADQLWGTGNAEYGLLDPVFDRPGTVTSTDGRTWTKASLAWMPKLHALSDGLWALSSPLPTDDDYVVPAWLPRTPGAFRSADRREWAPVASPPGAFLEEVGAVGDTLLLAGSTGKSCWIPSNCTVAAWRSVDGGASWASTPITGTDGSPEPRGGTIVALAAIPDGTVVGVGRTVSANGSPSTAAWVSLPRVGD